MCGAHTTRERTGNRAFVVLVGRFTGEEQPVAERLRELFRRTTAADLRVAVRPTCERIGRVVVKMKVVDRFRNRRRASIDGACELGHSECCQLACRSATERLCMWTASP